MALRFATALALTAGMAATVVVAQDAPPSGPGPMFERVDANGDGSITREEIEAARKARTEGLDANSDGYLTAEEIVNFRMVQERARIERQVARMLAERDLNADGRLGADELLAAGPMGGPRGGEGFLTRHFVAIDTDKNGTLSPEEMSAFREKGREARRDGRGPHGDHRKGDDGPRDGRGGPHGGPRHAPPEE